MSQPLSIFEQQVTMITFYSDDWRVILRLAASKGCFIQQGSSKEALLYFFWQTKVPNLSIQAWISAGTFRYSFGIVRNYMKRYLEFLREYA